MNRFGMNTRMKRCRKRSSGIRELSCSGNLESEQLIDVAAMTDQALPEQRREDLGGCVQPVSGEVVSSEGHKKFIMVTCVVPTLAWCVAMDVIACNKSDRRECTFSGHKVGFRYKFACILPQVKGLFTQVYCWLYFGDRIRP